jgi:hypothetical protein
MIKVSMMTGTAAYVLGFGLYLIVFVSSNWGDKDWVILKISEGLGMALVWPFLLFQYFWSGTPMM